MDYMSPLPRALITSIYWAIVLYNTPNAAALTCAHELNLHELLNYDIFNFTALP